MTTLMEKSVRRVDQLDYLKCFFITLMVIFHLVYIGDKYPYAKQVVYTFHMPAFLVLSGYLLNVRKEVRPFLRNMGWIFIPYAVMEAAYVLGASLLPIREHIGHLTFPLLMEKVLLSPIGPYWYLHTLIVCGLTYYVAFRLFRNRRSLISFFIVVGLLYAAEAAWAGVVSLPNAFYFLAGAVLRRTSVGFCSFFRPSLWAVLPFVWLASDMSNLDRALVPGVLLTYLAVSLSLVLYRCLPERLVRAANFIGANTFILLVFSPIFTMLVKPLVPVFSFDSSGMLFLAVSLAITVSGCLGIAWLMDKLRLSPYFWGKARMIQRSC